MPLHRRQFVCGIVTEMRKSHGAHARTILAKRSAEYRTSGNYEMADVWNEALRELDQLEAKINRLVQFGYIGEGDGSASP